MTPGRRKRPKMGLRCSSVVRSQGHLKNVRGRYCILFGKPGHDCTGRHHAHHVQSYRAIEGGMGMKVGDDKTVCLCDLAHEEVHRIGQDAFQKKWGTDLEAEAATAWREDADHRRKWELEQGAMRRPNDPQ